ncbi:hypothetical protein CANCADRAFT_12865, partial [Tortispora caseinolytica NRRL Y-17796]
SNKKNEESCASDGLEESTCSITCEECEGKYPRLKGIDPISSLAGSAKSYDEHILIGTGKGDWIRNIDEEPGSIAHAISNWKHPSIKGDIKISNSSLPVGVIVVLPQFLYFNAAAATCAEQLTRIFDELSTDSEKAPKGAKALECDNVVLLCSHKTRDKNCGITAPILKKEFELVLRDKELLRDTEDNRRGGCKVLYVSHIGGHKFAGNVIIYRKEGGIIWLGRIKPENVKPIVEESILKGKVWHKMMRFGRKTSKIDW